MAKKRDVAQLGSAPALGAGCRRFKSCHPDYLPYIGFIDLELWSCTLTNYLSSVTN